MSEHRPRPTRDFRETVSNARPILLSWSGGKDSALALLALARASEWEVVGLLTTFTERLGRVTMHGVRRELLEAQARALALELSVVEVPIDPSNQAYEARMETTLRGWADRGVGAVAFGDLFLTDVRAYRERMLAAIGMEAVFPLWSRPTERLADEFIGLGFQAVTSCVDIERLPAEFAGRAFDADFLADLPPGIDPCGEHGEFHTFVSAGPGLSEPVGYSLGELVIREGRFAYRDLLPA